MFKIIRKKGVTFKKRTGTGTTYMPLFLLCLLVVLIGCATVSSPTPIEPTHVLSSEIETILGDPLLAASNVGVKVVSLSNGRVIYENDADKLYHPASTMKLITAAAALVKLGPNYRFHTTLFADGVEDDNVIGNLYLQGRGDPKFDSGDLEKFTEKLSAMGVKSIDGDIVVDESYFDDIRRGKGWMWDDGPLGGYYSHLSALTINHNGVRVRVSPGRNIDDPVDVHLEPPTRYMKVVNEAATVTASDATRLSIKRQWKPVEANVLTIRGSMEIGQADVNRQVDVVDPALYCGTLLKEKLAQNGIMFRGSIRHGVVPERALKIANHVSVPLSRILWGMNKSSDNLTAELILKTIGAELKGAPGTAQKGIAAIGEFLKEIGLDNSRYTLADGSGVSRYNLVTASALTSLLTYMFNNFAMMPEYLVSLPIAGVDGTLKRRMNDMRAGGILRAKTGTMRGVSTLAGYTMTAEGEILAFAVLMSNFKGSANLRRSLQDKIGDALTRFSRDSNEETR
ncbi:MAG: D-alanyl-D-alanine carboxypeptidase/D-alanyl-D-alanine-endopeptidase [Candidatus Poribacteria bacterium]|nr:D-alanyl-D-alanine carboxypeptidase/D-alanyl-D-alanine-endopeptidase [Candidatus Poribacteria bacterium]